MKSLKFRSAGVFALAILILVLTACGTSSATSQATETPTQEGSQPPATLAPTATPEPTVTSQLPQGIIPTPTPQATATVTPTATPRPPTPVTREDDDVSRLGALTMDFLTTLTDEFSPRASATDEERAAAEYLLAEFEALGYDVKIQTFNVSILPPDVPVFSLTSPTSIDLQGLPMTLSGMGKVSGELVFVGLGGKDDIPGDGLNGKIALIERGVQSFEDKVQVVQEAGAIAAVVFNNTSGLFSGQLTSQASIPAIGISQETGQSLLELLGNGTVEATVTVMIEDRPSRNVIAEKPGTDPEGGVVILGGHFDTVPDVPGANDNGSGTAVLMAIAKEIAEKSYPFTIRIIPFGSEELGLLGSREYVRSLSAAEIDDIILMMNFDALGTGPTVGLLGNGDFVSDLIDYGADNGVAVERRFSVRGASSDHASFQNAGVPVVFFLADDFSRIHTPQDRLVFIDETLLGQHAVLGITMLDMLASGE